MPIKQSPVRKRRYQQQSCHFLGEGTRSWTVSCCCTTSISCCCTTSISFQHMINKNTPHRPHMSASYHINFVHCTYKNLCSQVNWDYHLPLSTKTDTQQLFLPYLSLLLLIISSVLPLDKIFTFFDYPVIVYRIRKAIRLIIKLGLLCMAVTHICLII